nr:helix-turn-helix domain-containing protein [Symmachiella macrocystis]
MAECDSGGPARPSAFAYIEQVIGEPAMKTIFTTGQVAKICKVAPRTVSKWFDSGRLRGYRIPGSQDRRIPREHLIRFLKEHGMPLGELEDEAVGKVLLVGSDTVIRNNLTEHMPPDVFKLEYANSGFEAGIQAESLHPDCVVIDFVMGRNDAIMIAQNLKKNNEYAETVLIGLLNDEDNSAGFDRTIFNETFRKPFDAALLAERIRTLVGRRKQLA